MNFTESVRVWVSSTEQLAEPQPLGTCGRHAARPGAAGCSLRRVFLLVGSQGGVALPVGVPRSHQVDVLLQRHRQQGEAVVRAGRLAGLQVGCRCAPASPCPRAGSRPCLACIASSLLMPLTEFHASHLARASNCGQGANRGVLWRAHAGAPGGWWVLQQSGACLHGPGLAALHVTLGGLLEVLVKCQLLLGGGVGLWGSISDEPHLRSDRHERGGLGKQPTGLADHWRGAARTAFLNFLSRSDVILPAAAIVEQ